jgi:hypothetical protein
MITELDLNVRPQGSSPSIPGTALDVTVAIGARATGSNGDVARPG